MVIVAAGSVAVAVSAGQVGLRATGVGEWAAPTCEGRWGNGDVVVAIALHKFGLGEKKKRKEKKLILLLPIEASGLCARKECAAGEVVVGACVLQGVGGGCKGVPVCGRACCPW